MAGWRGAGDGVLAGPLPRVHVGRAAGVVGSGLRAVGAGLRTPVWTAGGLAQGLWLARHAHPGRVAGPRLRLDPLLCEGAGSLDREQEAAGRDPTAGLAASVRHLQAEISV